MTIKKKVLLMGGLGNKFFQCARAVELSKNGYDVEAIFISQKMNFFYKLSGHTIHDEWLDVNDLCNKLKIKYRSIKFYELIFLGYIFFLKKLGFKINFNLKLENLTNQKSIKNNKWDVGYFQSLEHISSSSIDIVIDKLKSILNIKRNPSNYLSCHIRGGDFNNIDRVQKSSIKPIFEIAQEKQLNIVAITNDRNYCKELMGENNFLFHDGLSARDDFIKLASSEYLFLSNSTFSLWAALIASRSHNASIYFPSNWSFKDLLSGSQ